MRHDKEGGPKLRSRATIVGQRALLSVRCAPCAEHPSTLRPLSVRRPSARFACPSCWIVVGLVCSSAWWVSVCVRLLGGVLSREGGPGWAVGVVVVGGGVVWEVGGVLGVSGWGARGV